MSAPARWLDHEFTVYEPNVPWIEVPAVYIFAGISTTGRWTPIYVGETGNLRTRLAAHEKWSAAQRQGATHIHAVVLDDEHQRRALESLLIQNFEPRLNVQHRS